MTSELKPCPFCSGNPVSWLHQSDDHERYGYVSCEDCPAETKGKTLHWGDNTDAELSSQFEAELAWNTRAVPDVPELVRWKQYEHGTPKMISGHGGDWCEYDQAAAVIADEKQAAIDARNLLQYEKDQQWKERAEVAETKLAQIEKPIGYVSKSFFESLKIDRFHSIAAYVLRESSERYSEPLYTAPVASDADLRALALEVSQYTDPDYIPRDVFHRFRAALNPSEPRT